MITRFRPFSMVPTPEIIPSLSITSKLRLWAHVICLCESWMHQFNWHSLYVIKNDLGHNGIKLIWMVHCQKCVHNLQRGIMSCMLNACHMSSNCLGYGPQYFGYWGLLILNGVWGCVGNELFVEHMSYVLMSCGKDQFYNLALFELASCFSHIGAKECFI